jgi:hypothetical protein
MGTKTQATEEKLGELCSKKVYTRGQASVEKELVTKDKRLAS